MSNGVVQQTDTPLNLYNQPANLFVAGFLGSPPMNFLNGDLQEEGNSLVFSEIKGGSICVRLPIQTGYRDFIGKPVLLGIRPEDIELAQFLPGEAGSTASFAAIVDIVEPMGAETNLYLQTGAHTLVCRSQRALDHREAGRRFQFEMNLKKLHLFDPQSGKRVT
jgi:multiple sugar transport system ATP-binding protein